MSYASAFGAANDRFVILDSRLAVESILLEPITNKYYIF